MIVCSIVVDFGKFDAHLGWVFDGLGSKGAFLTDGSVIYFASDDPKIGTSGVKRILARGGYDQSIIKVFDRNSLPQQDNSPVVYGWLIDHIVANAKKQFEADNQAQLRKAASELDKLNAGLEKKIDENQQQLAKGTSVPTASDANGGKQDGGSKD